MYVCWSRVGIYGGGEGEKGRGPREVWKRSSSPLPPLPPFPLLPSPFSPLPPGPPWAPWPPFRREKKSVKQPSRTSGSSLASTRQANTNVYNPLCRIHIIFFNLLFFFSFFALGIFFLGFVFSFLVSTRIFFFLLGPLPTQCNMRTCSHAYARTCTCYTLHVTRTYVCTHGLHMVTHTCHTRSHAHAHDNIRYTPTVTLNQSCWNYFSPSSHPPSPLPLPPYPPYPPPLPSSFTNDQ